MSKLKVGDVVELKSGGGLMTIAVINGDKALCEWKDAKAGYSKEFSLTSLILHEPMMPFTI
ncbi:DUF2158 domain-containing protein [Acinetobacter sp. ABJ_C3_5]|uniref:DUF2158 domain-containing protein n=1 Tax=Acinetobacter TaxID=469 RepID=UPI002DB71A06|nr:DUF2158 domain-containing protein [Acinetobacter vivianii]MEB6666362.1 DUF2158 domain-containing protein [Acinetobacter vivianii]